MSFKKDFMWGVATAAYQVEGAAFEDDKGLSNWDVFCQEKGRIKNGDSGDVACDHYHKLEEDVRLMSELGVNTYRFSISWARIFPDGIGEVNQKGIEFYNKLIDLLLANNITPCLTLFHWDYPYELEKKGAWLNPDSPSWFQKYAEIVAKHFGDRVKYFITFNEPQCFVGIGYRSGRHAPGKKFCDRDIVSIAHNVMLAHGLAVIALRKFAPGCKVGYAPTGSGAIPMTNSEKDIEVARKRYFEVELASWTWSVSWWSAPVLLGHYPEETEAFKELSKHLPANYKDDLKIISQPLDFYGQNIYNGARYKSNGDNYEWVPNNIGQSKTAINWPVTPSALYWAPKFLFERYNLPIMITENGMSCHDVVSLDGQVHDPNRIDFLNRYLLELKKAAEDGVDIWGYMCWTFIDNFEWVEGFNERFGFVYVDFENQKRIKKDSFGWYNSIIKCNGDNL